ncbi:hypothetical protein AX16_005472 [Volvariella volvacea WC 439]|nr:hypothetical protein AX16_005472 [Volvariella volvacea WC 439]
MDTRHGYATWIGEKLRRHRRLILQKGFHPTCQKDNHEVIRIATYNLLRQLLDDPDDWHAHLRLMTGRVILGVTYGLKLKDKNDPYIGISEAALKILLAAMVPGRFVLDYLPFLKWIPEWVPGASFKKLAKKGQELAMNLEDLPYEACKAEMDKDMAPPSFVSRALKSLSEAGSIRFIEEDAREAAGSMFAGEFP